MKKLLILSFALTCCRSVATARHHYDVWLRATAGIQWTDRIITDLEWQHRRQNSWNSIDPLGSNLMYTFRSWLHYEPGRYWRLSVSPFAWFTHYPVINKPADAAKEPFHEFRFSVASEWRSRKQPHVQLINRSALEYRLMSTGPTDIWRLRHRLTLQHMVNPRLSLDVYNELFANLAGVAHLYDQDRLGFQFNCGLSACWRLEAGYMHVFRLPAAAQELQGDENIVLNIRYRWPLHRQHARDGRKA